MYKVMMPTEDRFDFSMLNVKNLNYGSWSLSSSACYSQIFSWVRKLKLQCAQSVSVKFVNQSIWQFWREPKKAFPSLQFYFLWHWIDDDISRLWGMTYLLKSDFSDLSLPRESRNMFPDHDHITSWSECKLNFQEARVLLLIRPIKL